MKRKKINLGRELSQEEMKSIGLGDTVEKLIKKATGGRVKTCGKCKERREALNKMFPYGS